MTSRRDPSLEITALLRQAGTGDPHAREKLFPLVEARLHGMAQRLFLEERAGHTLQPTAMVDEIYVNLVCADRDWEGRIEFYSIAATAMRRMLARHARDRGRQKRGGKGRKVTLSGIEPSLQKPMDLVELEEALCKLEEVRPRLCRIVEHRLFAGLTNQETAGALGMGLRTVELEWRAARAWLQVALGDGVSP